MNPFSAAYGAATALRNRLYDRGALRSRRLSRPVISIGNISAGGSGKTPFVILLGELLKQRGISFDVLSRGYGRNTRGVLAVEPNGSPLDFGDEPLLIANRLACPVVVGESRYEAGLFAEKQFQASLHILDDGFQHRSLARDFDIVLLTPDDLRDQLLPAGRLREPLSSLRRADAIVLTEPISSSYLPSDKPVWRLRRGLALPETPKQAILFCGIARPHKFVEQLQAVGIRPAAQKFYRDHHKYTQADVRDLLELRRQHRSDSFITTEKDEINLAEQAAKLSSLVVARVNMELIEPADALDTMLRVISERSAKA